MTIDELKKAAQNVGCYLTIPRKTLPKGYRIRLAGRSGPFGRICCVNQAECGFEVVANFKGPEVLAWIEKMESTQ